MWVALTEGERAAYDVRRQFRQPGADALGHLNGQPGAVAEPHRSRGRRRGRQLAVESRRPALFQVHADGRGPGRGLGDLGDGARSLVHLGDGLQRRGAEQVFGGAGRGGAHRAVPVRLGTTWREVAPQSRDVPRGPLHPRPEVQVREGVPDRSQLPVCLDGPLGVDGLVPEPRQPPVDPLGQVRVQTQHAGDAGSGVPPAESGVPFPGEGHDELREGVGVHQRAPSHGVPVVLLRREDRLVRTGVGHRIAGLSVLRPGGAESVLDLLHLVAAVLVVVRSGVPVRGLVDEGPRQVPVPVVRLGEVNGALAGEDWCDLVALHPVGVQEPAGHVPGDGIDPAHRAGLLRQRRGQVVRGSAHQGDGRRAGVESGGHPLQHLGEVGEEGCGLLRCRPLEQREAARQRVEQRPLGSAVRGAQLPQGQFDPPLGVRQHPAHRVGPAVGRRDLTERRDLDVSAAVGAVRHLVELVAVLPVAGPEPQLLRGGGTGRVADVPPQATALLPGVGVRQGRTVVPPHGDRDVEILSGRRADGLRRLLRHRGPPVRVGPAAVPGQSGGQFPGGLGTVAVQLPADVGQFPKSLPLPHAGDPGSLGLPDTEGLARRVQRQSVQQGLVLVCLPQGLVEGHPLPAGLQHAARTRRALDELRALVHLVPCDAFALADDRGVARPRPRGLLLEVVARTSRTSGVGQTRDVVGDRFRAEDAVAPREGRSTRGFEAPVGLVHSPGRHPFPAHAGEQVVDRADEEIVHVGVPAPPVEGVGDPVRPVGRRPVADGVVQSVVGVPDPEIEERVLPDAPGQPVLDLPAQFRLLVVRQPLPGAGAGHGGGLLTQALDPVFQPGRDQSVEDATDQREEPLDLLAVLLQASPGVVFRLSGEAQVAALHREPVGQPP
ncbi:hypothetical protein RKD37_007840 [Streptomyces ambofaciens]